MSTKGLCLTCVYDKGCLFPQKYPVFECDEFSVTEDQPKAPKRKKRTPRKKTR